MQTETAKKSDHKENLALVCKDVGITFGGLQAVNSFSVEVKEGELLGLIGPNGAGKTTVFNMLSGIYTPTTGEILLKGKRINGTSPDKLAMEGIARTYQNIRLFDYLTVLENVKVAMNHEMSYGMFAGMFRTPKYWKEEEEASARGMKILEVLGLEEYANIRAGSLPYGPQRKLEIARALATNPTVLLLDEPAAGMNATETAALMETIRLIRDRFNTTVILIEHDMSLVLGICERLIVLNHGEIIAQGNPMDVIEDEEVITAYLGSTVEEDK